MTESLSIPRRIRHFLTKSRSIPPYGIRGMTLTGWITIFAVAIGSALYDEERGRREKRRVRETILCNALSEGENPIETSTDPVEARRLLTELSIADLMTRCQARYGVTVTQTCAVKAVRKALGLIVDGDTTNDGFMRKKMI